MSTTFGTILRSATAHIPGAVGAAFVAGDGELVDCWTDWEKDDWLFLTAHMGILVSHVRSSLYTFHFGDIIWTYFSFRHLDILAEQVADKYFVLLTCKPSLDMDTATAVMHLVAKRLREEML